MSKLNCKGVGLVIDDQVPLGEEPISDPIGTIVSQLSSDGVPLLRYRELPSKGQFENFHGLAFALVDWSLLPREAGDTGDAAIEAMKAAICRFVKSFHAECFAPVFIFSNQDEGEIKEALKDAKIEVDCPNAYVLVRSKSEMKELDDQQTPKLFGEINNWIRATPTIGLLTTWRRELSCARDKMFADFYDKSHNWPMLLWNAYKGDGDDPAHGLSDLMFDNLRARLHCDFTIEGVPEPMGEADVKSVADVLSLSVMLPTESLPSGQIGCGDLFNVVSGEGNAERLELVVSCDCDCIVHNGESADEKLIQLLTVDKPIERGDSKMRNQRYDKEYGLAHKASESYLFPIRGRCFRVWYKGLSIKALSDIKVENRIGRVLPPFITDIRQRLAQWNQRVGLPKLPEEMFRASGAR